VYPLLKLYIAAAFFNSMDCAKNNYASEKHSNENFKYSKNMKNLKLTLSLAACLVLISYAFVDTAGVLFKRGVISAMGQVSNQTNIQKDKSNVTTKSPTLVMSNLTGNITKMTTTQGNQTTNANAASPFPPNQANSSKTFPATNKVAIVLGAALLRDKAYQPNPVNVKAGGTVTWTNQDTVVHTVTSGSGLDDPSLGRDFDSGLLGKGFSHIFFKLGEFPYFCQIHPTMVGKVIVK